MKKRYWIAGASGLAGAAVAAKLLSRPADVEWSHHAGQLPHAERSWFTEVNGVRVHYHEAGAENAPAVMLIHGFAASNFVWSEVLLPMARARFRIVAPDLLGFGFSEKPRDGEYTIEAQARLIIGLMDKLGIERAALVGSSYGAAIAATCALDYPERVERLVMVGAVINDEAKHQALLRLASAPLVGDVVAPLLLGSRAVVRRRWKRIYAKGAEFNEEKFEARHLPMRTSNMHRATLRTLRCWNAARIERLAHLIKHPTLLVWGEDDRDTPLRHGKYLRSVMPNARLIVFRHCGHLPQEEFPQEFTEVVTEFCAAREREVMTA